MKNQKPKSKNRSRDSETRIETLGLERYEKEIPMGNKNLVKQEMELEQKYIERAWRAFSKIMKSLSLDRQGVYPSFEDCAKEMMGYVPAGSELYTQYSHDAAEWIEAAQTLAFEYHIGDEEAIAKAEEEFHKFN